MQKNERIQLRRFLKANTNATKILACITVIRIPFISYMQMSMFKCLLSFNIDYYVLIIKIHYCDTYSTRCLYFIIEML